MKLLLDENLPRRLKKELAEFEVSRVREQGWSGVTNGELLGLLLSQGFDALLTFDKNLQHQQNFQKYPVPVLVLIAPSNKYADLRPLTSGIKRALASLRPGPIVVSE